MTDHNTTLTPQEARRRSGGLTQHFRAVQAKKAERAAENPTRALVESVGGKAIGLALLYWAQREWPSALETEGRFDDWTAIGAAIVGLYFIMPTTVKALFGMVRPLLPWGKKNGDA